MKVRVIFVEMLQSCEISKCAFDMFIYNTLTLNEISTDDQSTYYISVFGIVSIGTEQLHSTTLVFIQAYI